MCTTVLLARDLSIALSFATTARGVVIYFEVEIAAHSILKNARTPGIYQRRLCFVFGDSKSI